MRGTRSDGWSLLPSCFWPQRRDNFGFLRFRWPGHGAATWRSLWTRTAGWSMVRRGRARSRLGRRVTVRPRFRTGPYRGFGPRRLHSPRGTRPPLRFFLGKHPSRRRRYPLSRPLFSASSRAHTCLSWVGRIQGGESRVLAVPPCAHLRAASGCGLSRLGERTALWP